MTTKIDIKYSTIHEAGLPSGSLFVLSTKNAYMIVRGPPTTSIATVEQWSCASPDALDELDALLARAVSLLRSTKTSIRVVVSMSDETMLRVLYINGFSSMVGTNQRKEYVKRLL